LHPQTNARQGKTYFDELERADEQLNRYLLGLEKAGMLMRIDPSIWPTKFKCATVSEPELEELRRIGNIVREGRVAKLTNTHLEMQSGSKLAFGDPASVLFVDCTADGLSKRPSVDVFDGERMTLQSISLCQQVFSAAALAYIESCADLDDAGKNALARPCPHPEHSADFLYSFLVTMDNRSNLMMRGPRARAWMDSCRLNSESHSSFLTKAYLMWNGARMLRNMNTVMDKARIMYEKEGHRLGFELFKSNGHALKAQARMLEFVLYGVPAVLLLGTAGGALAARARLRPRL